MIPSAFEYHRPASLAEAMQLLASREDAKLLSGGHSVFFDGGKAYATPVSNSYRRPSKLYSHT